MTPEEIQQAIEKLKDLVSTSQNQEAKAFAYELLENQAIQEDPESLAKVYNLLGNVFGKLFDYPNALEYYAKSLQINEKIKNNIGIAKNLGNFGLVYQHQQKYTKSLEYHERSLLIYEEIDYKSGIANTLGNIGFCYFQLSEGTKALDYYYQALTLNEQIENKIGISSNLTSIGIVYHDLSDYQNALEFYKKSLQIDEEIDNKKGISSNLGNIGQIYYILSDNTSAIEYYKNSLQYCEQIGNKEGTANNLANIGSLYSSLGENSKALEYYYESLQIYENLKNILGIANTHINIGNVYYELTDYPKSLEFLEKSLHQFQGIGNKLGYATALMNIGNVYDKKEDYLKALENLNYALQIFEENGYKEGVSVTQINIGCVYKNLFDFPNAIKYLTNGYKLSNSIGTKENSMNILKEFSDLYEKIGDIDKAFTYHKQYISHKEEIQSIDAKKQTDNFHLQRKIAEREIQLAEERGRLLGRESILRNILPDSVTDRLVKGENPIADHFETASVLFMDLVGFTALSSIAPPKQLVYLLDSIFTKADEVLEQFGLEKIKTIGDGYLAVANLTRPLEHHQKATAQVALQLLETMRDFTVNIPSDLGDTEWTKDMNDIEIRVGIHTGEVVAGIIGKNKYTYDLWGDAVNIASRMESNSEAGRIHVSEDFAKSIEQYSEFKLIPRGEITIKGKGKMTTYWLESGKL